MFRSGAKWLRLDFPWSVVERNKGTFDWSAIDRVVTAASNHGLEILALPAYTPAWARPTGTTDKTAPTDPAAFAAFVGAAAARYALRGVHSWEVWNEPNISNFWAPRPSVSGYVDLLAGAYKAIHSADANATVISGGLSPALDAADGSQIAPMTFVRQMYALGAKGFFDAVGLHPYSFPYSPLTPGSSGWNTFQQTPMVHQIMADHGDDAKKVWLTESGFPTGTSARANTEQEQSDYIRAQYDTFATWSFAGPFFTYMLRDTGSDAADLEQNFGLLRNGWSAKPAWSTFVTEMAAPNPFGGTPAPAAPSGLAAQAMRRAATLTWTPVGSGSVSAYRAEWSTQPPAAMSRTWTVTSTTAGTSMIVSRLTAGITYYFRVRSVSGPRVSKPSLEASAIPWGRR